MMVNKTLLSAKSWYNHPLLVRGKQAVEDCEGKATPLGNEEPHAKEPTIHSEFYLCHQSLMCSVSNLQ